MVYIGQYTLVDTTTLYCCGVHWAVHSCRHHNIILLWCTWGSTLLSTPQHYIVVVYMGQYTLVDTTTLYCCGVHWAVQSCRHHNIILLWCTLGSTLLSTPQHYIVVVYSGQGFLRFSSHGQCNISNDDGQICIYCYQSHYRAYIQNTIFFIIILLNFTRAWRVSHGQTARVKGLKNPDSGICDIIIVLGDTMY